MKNYLLLFCLLFSYLGTSQNIKVNDEDSYKKFVSLLENSKDQKYQETLKKYDEYITSHPNDVSVKIYRCKYIGTAYYDDYEDYNPKYDETNECIDELYEIYPNEPEVILYKLDQLYGEDLESLYEDVIARYDHKEWSDDQSSRLFLIGAYHFTESDDDRAIRYAEKAISTNDSLDLSILLTRAYIREDDKDSAKESILSKIDEDSEAWVLNTKGELLLELEEDNMAFEVFNRMEQKDSTYSNNESLYKIFIKANKIEQARSYILKDTVSEWNKIMHLQRLLEHDLEYGSSDVQLQSYRRLQEESYFDDILGVKRLKIFFSDPLKPWNFNELTHIPILLLVFVFIFIMPYLWVLPIYALGNYFRKIKFKLNVLLPKHWNLKHFWLISFVYLLVQVILLLLFYYEDYINLLFDIGYYNFNESEVETDAELALPIVFFTILSFVFTMLFLNKERIRYLLRSNISALRIIGLSIGFVILNGFILRFLGNFVDLTEVTYFFTQLDMKAEIRALLSEHGFYITVLLVAILVPIYEEVIFRGIILNSTEKHIGFVKANIFQAILFASVHFNLSLFIFYFIFGLITGYATRKTNGLITGIMYHAVNNFFVVVALYYSAKQLAG